MKQSEFFELLEVHKIGYVDCLNNGVLVAKFPVNSEKTPNPEQLKNEVQQFVNTFGMFNKCIARRQQAQHKSDSFVWNIENEAAAPPMINAPQAMDDKEINKLVEVRLKEALEKRTLQDKIKELEENKSPLNMLIESALPLIQNFNLAPQQAPRLMQGNDTIIQDAEPLQARKRNIAPYLRSPEQKAQAHDETTEEAQEPELTQQEIDMLQNSLANFLEAGVSPALLLTLSEKVKAKPALIQTVSNFL